MGKKRAMLARMDWDAAFYADMQNDVGFQITEPAEISLDGSKEKSMYGPQSPLYGTTYGDEREFIERWRCKCGRKKSRAYEGEECPFCHSKVEARGSNINICGWISLVKSGAFVIQPLYFRILAQAIGKEFAEIVNCKKKVDTNGIQSELKPGDLDFIPSHPFYGIGIQKFRDRYEEILDYYMHQSNKKNKIHTFELLLAQKDQVFTQHIPVYSTYLRPQSITQDTFYFQGADKMINVIFKLSEQLEDCPDIEWDNFQARLQIKVNMLWDYDFQSMHGKEGIIRDMLLGGSLNKIGRHKTDLIAGTSVKHQLPTKCGDIFGAKGNSGDMVIKVDCLDNRRSEVSHNDEICAQRLGKARHPHSMVITRWVENKVAEMLHEASRPLAGEM